MSVQIHGSRSGESVEVDAAAEVEAMGMVVEAEAAAVVVEVEAIGMVEVEGCW